MNDSNQTSKAGRRTAYVSSLTFMRPDSLPPLLEAFHGLERPKGWDVRFLIVDNDPEGSGRSTVEAFMPRFNGALEYAIEPKAGIPFARNRALNVATANGASLLCFTDDDAWPDQAWLRELVGCFEETGAVLIGGPRRFRVQGAERSLWARFLAKSIIANESFVQRYAAKQARKGIVVTSGTYNWMADLAWIKSHDISFDTGLRFSGGSDTMFRENVRRHGGKLAWCDRAVIYEGLPLNRISLAHQFRRAVSNGMTEFRTGRRASPAVLRYPLGRILVGLGLIALPVIGWGSFIFGVRMIGMGLGVLRGRHGAESNLYARD